MLTLLVLELKIPEGLPGDRILPALIENGPRFAAFGIAFSAAAVGWSYSYLAHSLMVRSNFSHIILTFATLLGAALIPFVSQVMGSYPDAPWGYIPYCIAIGFLSLVLGIDLMVNGHHLVDHRMDRGIIVMMIVASLLCATTALVTAFIALWSPRAAFWIIVAGTILIWLAYFYLTNWIGRVRARIEHGEEAPPVTSDS